MCAQSQPTRSAPPVVVCSFYIYILAKYPWITKLFIFLILIQSQQLIYQSLVNISTATDHYILFKTGYLKQFN